MAADPEEDINLAGGQFTNSEELWNLNRITTASTVMKIKMNPRQVVNCLNFDLICLTNVPRSLF